MNTEDTAMKTMLRLTLALALAGAVGLPAGLIAGAKKDKEPEKKKPEPIKPIIVDGELINADLKDKQYQQSFSKTYTFKMEKGRTYQIEMGSRVFQSALRIEDNNGTTLAQAIDPFGNQKAMILYEPAKTDDYQIVCTTPAGGAVGKFNLTIKDASAFSILNVKDTLNQNDKAYAGAGNKKHKLFHVNLEAGKTYQIDMKSRAFDSYLFFESPGGKLLAQDDDSGGFPDARIIHKATETGKFRIICTYFGNAGVGEFNLTVRLMDGDPPLPVKEGKKEEKKE
jgi:hypothetical protein